MMKTDQTCKVWGTICRRGLPDPS